jgi:hypothetical protein
LVGPRHTRQFGEFYKSTLEVGIVKRTQVSGDCGIIGWQLSESSTSKDNE